MPTSNPDAVRDHVREGYSKIAQTGQWLGGQSSSDAASSSCCAGGGCCGPTMSVDQLAKAIGYSEHELATLPEGSNLGLSCGNPAAIAALRPGETVVDLGAGAGFDCFLAGPKVGALGRVIGVDMTPNMLAKSRQSVPAYTKRSGLSNVEFRLGEIEHLPIADNSVDVVISNCVLNLSPDKPQVWREIARVLKPTGRAAISDLALLKPLPPAVLQMMDALIGCVAGAVLITDIEAMIRAAGLTDLVLTRKPEYIQTMSTFKDPLYQKIVEALPAGAHVSDYITSLDISATKPRPAVTKCC